MTEKKAHKRMPPFYQEPNPASQIRRVIAVMSGKGGVGKSLVTGLSALAMQRAGWNTAIMDADITGPSIPRAFGLHGGLEMENGVAVAARTRTGIQVVSTNLILPNETDPVIWKGPMVGSAVKQFWSDFIWRDVDYLFVDMPPGTGDVPLTVYQTLPVDGIIIVTSPQELVSMIVEKAINMAKMMGVPVLGVIENLSYFHAEDTGRDYAIFGESHVDEICAKHHLEVLAKLPIDPRVAQKVDAGAIEEVDTTVMERVVQKLGEIEEEENVR
ncbi:MAG: Mrp/NBP35 family ATP-binding protein [Ndongobacter sp.]|nr:Mrp/NBP35 family ATP-binding protein [Ndongobacter sp.]